MWILLAALLAATAAPASQQAASIGVSPLKIDQPGDDRTAVITLSNHGGQTATLQVRLFRWSQIDGDEVFDRTDDIVASPPVSIVEPGQRSIARVVRLASSPPAAEESYRLLIDELPSPNRHGGTVQFAVRHSIPIFFQAAVASQPKLGWRIDADHGAPRLQITNTGGRYARLSRVILSDVNGEIWRHEGLFGYVLAGATMSWSLPDALGQPLTSPKLTVETDHGSMTIPLMGED